MRSLAVPRDGLDELFRNWSGDGPLYDAIAATSNDDDDERAWTATDTRRRARRVLLGNLEPELTELPASVTAWEEILPIASETERLVGMTPRGGVNWAGTARLYGWPPSAYMSHRRHRIQDETALTCLAWLASRLGEYVADIGSSSPLLYERLASTIGALIEAAHALLGDTTPVRPDRSDLMSLRTSGQPWPLVARIASAVARTEDDPSFIAFDLLEPDPDTAWRLFQLSTFGQVVRTLRQAGCRLSWKAPIGGSRQGPRMTATAPQGDSFDLWFESGGARHHYGLLPSAYKPAVASVAGAGGPIGTDVALIAPGQRALLLECKWSENVNYVARDGFHQAVSYALDARDGMTETAWSFVVGPTEVIPKRNVATNWLEDWAILVGSTAVPDLGLVVNAFLANDPLLLLPDRSSP